MSAADDRAAMYEANYSYHGVDALWNGAPSPVKVIIEAPDVTLSLGQTRMVVGSTELRVRAIEVPAPKKGDTVEIGTQGYLINAAPDIDAKGDIWTCQAVKVSS